MRFSSLAAAALVLGGCSSADVSASGSGIVERAVGGQKYRQRIERVESPAPELARQLAAATTVNIDAPGLAPVAADALPAEGEAIAGAAAGGEGILVAASEPEASFSVDGYPAQKVAGGAPVRGWHRALGRVGAGVHAVKVEKEGFFPVETQVLVRPGVVEALAVRLGKVVMRGTGGIRKP